MIHNAVGMFHTPEVSIAFRDSHAQRNFGGHNRPLVVSLCGTQDLKYCSGFGAVATPHLAGHDHGRSACSARQLVASNPGQ
jgi:hypothetical protein